MRRQGDLRFEGSLPLLLSFPFQCPQPPNALGQIRLARLQNTLHFSLPMSKCENLANILYRQLPDRIGVGLNPNKYHQVTLAGAHLGILRDTL